jgi:23S rRNA pseudouridine1911/1915/1917 synthase
MGVRLDTGRNNQIRVQFAEEGYPIVGDQHYAPAEKSEKRIDRQALHAYKLTIEHPHKKRPETYQAKIPPDLRALLKFYRRQ